MVQEYMEENGYTDLDIDKMPLACQGTNSADTVYSKEMNRVLRIFALMWVSKKVFSLKPRQ